MRIVLASALALAPTLFACTQDGSIDDGGADLAGQDEKGDAVPGIEVQSRLRPTTTVDAAITTAVPRPGFVFYAAEGSKVTVEVTHAGSSTGLDTLLKIYGPRLADGSYPKTVATDEDSGYGKLSKVSGLEVSIPGFYLVELTNGAAAAPATNAKARLKLSCTGVCDTDASVQPLGLDLRWYQRSAERHALSLQSYAAASAAVSKRVAAGNLPASWGVVMDIDETTLDNSAYQKARAELGTGYSPGSWTEWVNRKAAPAVDGALAFSKTVKQLGGKVVFVSNRIAATECPQTQQNLTALGFAWDDMQCKTTTSDKNPRFDQVKMNMEIVAFVGDNILDFPQLSQDLRKQPESAYAAFGDKFFIIPNPMYGSFEKNVD
jgi:5'-nucleotidase (lipoprotein e(P4) family)